MGWVNKDSGTKKLHSTNKKKQLGGSLKPPVAPLGGGLNPNMPAPPNVGVPNPYLKEGGELKKDVSAKTEYMRALKDSSNYTQKELDKLRIARDVERFPKKYEEGNKIEESVDPYEALREKYGNNKVTLYLARINSKNPKINAAASKIFNNPKIDAEILKVMPKKEEKK